MTPQTASDPTSVNDVLMFDGLVVSKWGPDVFRAMKAAGLSGINATCAVWEGFRATINNIAHWYSWFDQFPE